MHREDDSKYLLYIEPKASDKLETPIDDEITQIGTCFIKGEEGNC